MFEHINLSIDYKKEFNQKVLFSSTENVNLIHEILRQTFYLNLQDSTIKCVLDMFKKWFLREAVLPYFIQDIQLKQNMTQMQNNKNIKEESCLNSKSLDTVVDVKIGFIRSLQMFLVDSSVLFFNRINLQRDRIMDTCGYVLDIIKLLIGKVQMDQNTW